MRRIEFRSIFIYTILIFLSLYSINAERLLSLEEAIDIALENNRDLLIAGKELDYANAQIKEAYGAAYPVIDINLGSSHQNKVRKMSIPTEEGIMEIPMGNKNNYFGNISITQPIWVGGKVGAALEGAKQFKSFMSHNVENIRQQIIYATKVSYYAVLLSHAYMDISESTLRQSESHYKQVKDMYEQGMASRFDLLRAEVAVSNNKPSFLKAQNGYELSLIRLKSILSIDLDDKIVIKDEFVYEPYDITEEEGLLYAMENREDLKAMELEIKMNETMKRITQADYYPSIFFNTEYSAVRDTSARNNVYGEASAGFLLRWSFNFGTRGRIDQSDIRVRQSVHQRAKLKSDIENDIREAYLKLQEAESIILSQKKVIEVAEEALQIAEVRYQSGTGTHLEITDAQLSLNMAKTNYIQALFDYIVARATVDKVIGIL